MSDATVDDQVLEMDWQVSPNPLPWDVERTLPDIDELTIQPSAAAEESNTPEPATAIS